MSTTKPDATTDKYGNREYRCNICGRTYGKNWLNHVRHQHKGETVRPLGSDEEPERPDCELETGKFKIGHEAKRPFTDSKSMAAPALANLNSENDEPMVSVNAE